MRVSEQKKQANRQNAQKSTGPKTEEGKQTVSQNGVKHGLYTHALILNSPNLKEDQTEYLNLVLDLEKELTPEGVLENTLVRTIANCIWRSRRVTLAETAQIERQLEGIDSDVRIHIGLSSYIDQTDEEPSPEYMERLRKTCIGKNAIPCENIATNLLRYELRLNRELSRALKTLYRIQYHRKAKEAEGEKENSLKMSDQSQIPYNPKRDNPLWDIK